MNLQADPKNEDGLIVLNVDAWKSSDGGKNFKKIPVQHGDTHDVWINPKTQKISSLEMMVVLKSRSTEVPIFRILTFQRVSFTTYP